MTLRRAGAGLLALVVLVAAGAAWYLRPIAPVATGYAALITCSTSFLQARTIDDGLGDLPDNPLVPFLRAEVDADGRAVEATLLGLAGSRAEHVEGTGCRLVDDDAVPVDAVLPVDVGTDDLTVADDPSAAAAAAGLDAAALDAVVDVAFDEGGAPEGGVLGTRAVVVVHGGQVVAERYADGFDASTPLLGWSMGKSVAQAMVGRLVRDDLLALDQDELRPAWDDERGAITLDQLLHMSSGLAFDEVYDPGTDATTMLFTPRDTGAFAADAPLEHDPGTVWSYSSGTSNIVCDVVADAAGDTRAAALARDLVFAPLSMTTATMGVDAAGDPVCSSFGYASARDWARFGLLYLQDGVWGGERLLPEGWAAYAAAPVDLPTVEDGRATPYGAHWWTNTAADGAVRLADVPADAYWASGNEGQHVVVLPSHDAVVVRLGLSSGVIGAEDTLAPLVSGVVDALP